MFHTVTNLIGKMYRINDTNTMIIRAVNDRKGTLKLNTFSILSRKLDRDPNTCCIENKTPRMCSILPFSSSLSWY